MKPSVVVPIMLFLSSALMAFAWLGHIRFRHKGFWLALLMAWLLVLPEYALNVFAIRYGSEVYSGGQMASYNLCTGVLCVALVSRLFLGEPINRYQYLGFGIMAVAIVLVAY